jgi:hypothetical protein
MPLVPLIGFAPDVDATTPGAMLECVNMVPTLRGMRAASSSVATTYPASAEAVTGAALLQKLDASVRFFIGGATMLQEGVSGAWSNVSRSGGYAAGENRWRFCQFGNDSIAANKSCQLQRSTGAAFSNLTAPKADVCDTAAGFVILGNCDDTGTGLSTGFGDQPNRWWCSAINDVATWTPSIATQCASGLLVDAPGPIRAMRRLGANMVAYKDKSIFVGSYVGAQSGVWQWSLIPGDIGCSSQEAVVNIGTAHLFVGETDIYAFDGTRPSPIGAPLRQWFFARLNRQYQYKIAAMHDRVNGLVYWFYPSTASPTGALDEAIVYNYRAQRWGAVTRAIEMPIELVQGGVTYDNLGALFSTYDSLPAISYDSPFWIANTPVPALVGNDHRPYTASGPASSWAFASNVYGDEQVVSLVSRVNVRWITKPASASLVHRHSMDEADVMTAGAPVAMGSAGRFDLLRSARWHQDYVSGSGDAEIVGLDVAVKGAGRE